MRKIEEVLVIDGRSTPAAVYELKQLLRESRHPNHDNAIVADRRSYKTTALVEFVGERILLLPPNKEVGVVTPNRTTAEMFFEQYRKTFPTLRVPLLDPCEAVLHGKWRGIDVAEVYADEVFMMSPEILQVPNFRCGIGTLLRPVSIRIERW